MRSFRCAAAALLLAVPIVAAPVYTYNASFFPVKCSYAKLAQILQGVENYLNQSNGNVTRPTVEITLTHDQQSVKAATVDEFRKAAEVLPIAYDIQYSYSCYNCAAITYVRINLGDFTRKLSVEGSSHEHAEALFAMLSHSLSDLEVFIGGGVLRDMAGSLLIVCGLVVMIMGITESRTRVWRAVYGIGGALLVLAVFSLSWETILPGTAIYTTDPSPIVRYSPEISLAGAVLTVATFGLSIWYARRSEHRRMQKAKLGAKGGA